jgi:hypothetical protein
MTALLDLRAALSDLLGDYLGTYTLANGATTPAIAVRAIGEARKTGTTVSGMELIIERDPDTIQVQTQGQSPSVLEWTVWLVSWDESSLAAPAARLVAAFPNVEAEPVRVPEGSGPSNQIRVSLQIGQTLVVSGPPSGVTVTGTSSAALVILGSAAGFVGTVSIGTSSGTLITTGSAAGVVTVTAVSSQSLAFGGSASGGIRVGGASSQTLAITGTAAGLVGAGASGTGSSSATLAITGTATGTVRVAGASTQTLAITGTAAGVVRVTGSTAQTLAITGTAAGVIGAVAIGNSSATLAITGTVAGTVRVAGASAQSLAITGTAVGTVRVTGSTSQALAITGTAAGAISALAIGNSSATLAVTGTAAGTVRVAAASTQVLAITGTSAGTVRVTGSTSQTLSITGTAAGSLGGGRIGASSATLTITGTAAGVTAPLWTPADITGAIWFDSTDTAGITLISGNKVQNWSSVDRSVNLTQTNGANQGTWAAGQGVYMSRSHFLTSTYAQMSNSVTTVCWSSDFAPPANDVGALYAFNPLNDSSPDPSFAANMWNTYVIPGQLSFDSSNPGAGKGTITYDRVNGTPKAIGSPLAVAQSQKTIVATERAGFNDGAGQPMSNRFFQLNRYLYGSYLAQGEGYYYDIVICPSILPIGDTERLEGYIAHKWGIAASLPGGHPYKLVPPTKLIGASSQTLAITGTATGTVPVAGSSSQTLSITGTAAGVVQEVIVAENARTGVADSTVGVSTIGRGTDGFLGYAKQFSTDAGNSVSFAVDGVNAANIAIHRIGHYAGNRWRLVATISNTGTNQPDVQTLANSNGSTSASNWSTTATWSIPADAVSGLYVGVVRNSGNTAQSWIPFIVRNDSRTADIVIRVSDTTWGAAYNPHGTKASPFNGKTVYGEGVGASVFDINARGVQMSYDRPVVSRPVTAGAEFVNTWDNYESALIDWVEKNGFNVKYISCYDLDQGLTAVGSAKVLLNAGHDEYWSDGMLNNTEAFIDGGGHAVSMSANTQFWRIRWADAGRTFWCYKDTMPGPTGLRTGGAGTALDPVSWTGTWRDTRWGSRRPENLLLAGTFRMNGIRDESMVINGAANQAKPFWRSTTVASGTTLTVSQVIGFEADSLDFPNAGGVNLGTTNINIDGAYADNDGQTYTNNGTLNWGIACHYPRSGGTSGLVFNFCTNQWLWGLSDYHRRGTAVNNREMRQATYNLFTDLGAAAVTKESDLTTVSAVALSTYGATKVNSGSSAQTLSITGTAAGTIRVTGASAQTFAITGSAAGAVRVTGASAQTLTITGTASGTPTAIGSSSQPLSITGTATGTVRVTGSSIKTLAITGSAAGTVTGGSSGTFLSLSTTQYNSGATQVISGTVTLANVTSGNLVIALIQRVSQNNCTGVTLGGNAMTLLRRNYAAGGVTYGIDVWGIIAPSTGTSVAVVASYSTVGAFMTMTAACYSGVSSATVLASACNATGCDTLATTSTNRLTQSLTVGQSALLVVAGTDYDLVQAHTPNSGWTKRIDGSGTPLTSAQFLHDRNVVAGTYGGATAISTVPSTDQYESIMLAFPLT